MGVFPIMIDRLSNAWIVLAIILFVAVRPLFPYPICPTRLLVGTCCPTCGMTTALRYAVNGDIVSAMLTHLSVIPVMLIILRALVLHCRIPPITRDILDSLPCELALLAVLITTGLTQGATHYFQ